MASSLSEQLLKAGLITEEKVEKAEQEKKDRSKRKKAQSAKQSQPKNKKSTPKKNTHQKKSNDLAQFYKQRHDAENTERQREEAKRKEAARLKKERREKIKALIVKHRLSSEGAEIRYNFVIGTSVKYTFVTEEQQAQLIKGELGITFYANTNTLIPKEIGEQIREIDPNRVVFIPEAEDEDPIAE